MKKFLALVLALVMTMSLVTISAGAEFTDADSVTYEEAVDVMTALGVVTGDTNGAFNPTAGLTRGAAAKIICNMILGTDVAGALEAQEAPFADVATSNVFAGYIGFCKEEGIIGGYPDGTFKPADPLTGYAFLKMLLGALGYDADVEGFNSSNYAINVAKLAKQRGLTAGNEDYKGSAKITREEAMLYAYNTLLAEVVTYTGGSNNTITIGDIVIKNEGTATITSGVSFYEDNNFDLYLDSYSSLSYTNGVTKVVNGTVDSFARPAHEWYTDDALAAKDKVGTYAADATYTLVIDEAVAAATDEANVAAEIKELTKKSTLTALDNHALYFVNGKVATNNNVVLTVGDVVEVFVNSTDKTTVEKVAITQESAAQIVKVTANTSKAKAVKTDDNGDRMVYNVKIEIDLDMNGTTDITTNDLDLAGYTADYVKDTYLAVCLKDGAILSSKVAETETGAITGFHDGVNVSIDGVKYTAASTYVDDITTVDFKTGSYDVVLNSEGYAIAVNTVAAAAKTLTDVYFANGVVWAETDTKYGKTTTTVYAQLVGLDGVAKDIAIAQYTTATVGGYLEIEEIYDEQSLVAVTDNDGADDVVVVNTASGVPAGLKVLSEVAATDTVPAHQSLSTTMPTDYTAPVADTAGFEFKSSVSKYNGHYLTANTAYVLVKNSGADIEAKAYTGALSYKASSSESIYELYYKTGEIAAIVVNGSSLSLTSADVLYVAEGTDVLNGDSTYAQSKVYDLTGKLLDTITVDTASKSITKFVTFSTKDDVYTLNGTAVGTTTVDAGDWSDETTGKKYYEDVDFVKNEFYADRFNVTDGTRTMADIAAADMIVVDVRAESDAYEGTIESLSDLINVYGTLVEAGTYFYDITGDLFIGEDGAAVFFVTATSTSSRS